MPRLLGDQVESALSSVGITEERVQKWLGDCGCGRRKQRLNKLHQWAAGLFSKDKTELSDDDKDHAKKELNTALADDGY